MRWMVALACLLISCSLSAQQRIASLNLCTDLLLLELVERERIASLTYWAADPELSYLADRAVGLPLNQSLAEQIVPQRPDLVLAGQFSDVRVIALLERLGYPVAVMDVPLTLAGMREHILAFGELVAEPEAARRMADALDHQLGGLSSRARALESAEGSAPLAVVYGPQGVSPGTGTLMNDLLALAGYRNLAAEVGIVSYGTLPLEQLVRAQPTLLIVDDLSTNADSIAHHALRHPVLAGMFTPEQILELPPSLTACVGPGAVDVVERLLDRRVRLAGSGP